MKKKFEYKIKKDYMALMASCRGKLSLITPGLELKITGFFIFLKLFKKII
jgi:hypothetical protein